MDIMIIKVAAFGLNEKHLGKKLDELYDYFIKIVSNIILLFNSIKNMDFILVEKEGNLKV